METEQKIIKYLLKENKPFTIRKISLAINSDYKITYTAVKKLLDKKIIGIEQVGKSTVCSLNRWLTDKEVLLAECSRKEEILKNKNILQIYKEILSKANTSLFIMLLFGSFAKGSADKNSDIDLMLVSNEHNFERVIMDILRLIPLKIHPITLTEKDFTVMLNSKQKNVVKEAINNYIVLFGTEQFYRLMQNAR